MKKTQSLALCLFLVGKLVGVRLKVWAHPTAQYLLIWNNYRRRVRPTHHLEGASFIDVSFMNGAHGKPFIN